MIFIRFWEAIATQDSVMFAKRPHPKSVFFYSAKKVKTYSLKIRTIMRFLYLALHVCCMGCQQLGSGLFVFAWDLKLLVLYHVRTHYVHI